MKYEIRNIIYVDAPVENDDESINQKITIWVGIVGDPYGFIQKDPLIVTIPKTKTMVTGKQYVQAEAEKYKNKKYPDV